MCFLVTFSFAVLLYPLTTAYRFLVNGAVESPHLFFSVVSLESNFCVQCLLFIYLFTYSQNTAGPFKGLSRRGKNIILHTAVNQQEQKKDTSDAKDTKRYIMGHGSIRSSVGSIWSWINTILRVLLCLLPTVLALLQNFGAFDIFLFLSQYCVCVRF